MSRRRGMALVLALLVLLLVEVMSAGVIAMATQARVVAASSTGSLRAQSLAEAAVQRVLKRWQQSRFDTLAAGAVSAVPAIAGATDEAVSVTVERLLSSVYLIRADARVGEGSSYARARALGLARTLDRTELIAESNSAIASGGPLLLAAAASVRATDAMLPPAWTDSVCPATEALPPPTALISARAAAFGDDVDVAGPIALDSTLALPDSVALGGVRWNELAGIADRIESGTVAPAPTVADSMCVPAARANWGDPSSTGAPCSGYFPLIYVAGDLTISGGAGQGILAVDGTLTITGSFTFAGLVVAREGITAGPGARLFGALRSRTGYVLIEGSLVAFSRCAVARAALRTPSATRLVLAQRRFIPAF